jgi:hypothetical protein
MMSLDRGRMVDKHTLKSSSSVWSSDLFLLPIVFIAEKTASHRHDVETGRSTSTAFFVMTGYSCRRDNHNEAIRVSVGECFKFSFSLLSFRMSVSPSSSAGSNALDTNGSHTQSKEDTHQVTGSSFQCFYSAVTNFVELNRQYFCAVCNSVNSNISNLLFFFYSGFPRC